MKIYTISYTNQKGQLVIPKKIRKQLNINESVPLTISLKGNSIWISPIKEVITLEDTDSSYQDILKKTKGKWHDDNWDEIKKERRKTELLASKQRKAEW